jgi:transposase
MNIAPAPSTGPATANGTRLSSLTNRYKQFRRIATRYEKRAANYQAMWLIATIVLWLGFANTP